MSLLEKRIAQALSLILEAETLAEQGTAHAWEVARQYERAAMLLDLAANVCLERSRGFWSSTRRSSPDGEGGVCEVWVGEGGEIIDSGTPGG